MVEHQTAADAAAYEFNATNSMVGTHDAVNKGIPALTLAKYTRLW